jgi:hypothetical protein
MATVEDFQSSDPIEACIEAVRQADEREVSARLWAFRADGIRKREVFVNLEAICKATRAKFDRLSAGLPNRQLEFSENPARYFDVRNAAISGVTTNVGMSLDGSVLTIETMRHDSPNDVLPKTTDTVRVEVEGNSTYYLHCGRRVTAPEIADIILRPLLASLRAS